MNYTISAGELLPAAAINFSGECTADLMLHGIALDSRLVSSGAVFCAFPGVSADGRDFISEASSRGAALILCEAYASQAEAQAVADSVSVPIIFVSALNDKVGDLASAFYRHPSHEMQVFGVTGTNGKTTCCYLLVQGFEQMGMQAAMIGTIGAGGSTSLSAATLTTPDAITVHRQLAEFRDQGVSQVCMEVSSHALEQGRVNGVEFYCTLFTNLSQDHLDYHGDMESYGAAKQRLFRQFHSALCIVNSDDILGAGLIDIANSDFIASYGVGEQSAADVLAAEITASADGLQLLVEGNGVEFHLESSLVGLVNVPNLMLFTTTLLALSISIEDIQKIVRNLRPAPGRMELFRESGCASVVVDYAHTPDALEKALLSVREHCQGKLWCVFGCGGDRDRSKRPLMGRAAEKIADYLIITNDNPRSESPAQIAEDIATGIEGEAVVELDRAAAIRRAIEQSQKDDWVLIAGKGHETTQTIGAQVNPFSDREQVVLALGVAA